MTECVLRKRRRPISKPVADQILIDDVLKTSNTLLTDIFDVVEASFQLSSGAPARRFFATVFEVDFEDSRIN